MRGRALKTLFRFCHHIQSLYQVRSSGVGAESVESSFATDGSLASTISMRYNKAQTSNTQRPSPLRQSLPLLDLQNITL